MTDPAFGASRAAPTPSESTPAETRSAGADETAVLRRWLVAGTAGGVGTTTLTALLFAEARQRLASVPRLLDHTAGTLALRVPNGESRTTDDRWTLQDLGPQARTALATARERHGPSANTVVLVSAATPAGCRLAAEMAAEMVDELRDADPEGARTRFVLALVQVYRPVRITAALAELRRQGSEPVLLPADPALAVGGPIPLSRLARRTRRSTSALLDLLLAPS